jgi:hypothetical protein
MEINVLSWEISVLSWEINVLSWKINVLSWEISVLLWEIKPKWKQGVGQCVLQSHYPGSTKKNHEEMVADYLEARFVLHFNQLLNLDTRHETASLL